MANLLNATPVRSYSTIARPVTGSGTNSSLAVESTVCGTIHCDPLGASRSSDLRGKNVSRRLSGDSHVLRGYGTTVDASPSP